MKIYDLLRTLQFAVAADAELSAMAFNWYGQVHQVYLDQDKQNPPSEVDCPSIQFHSPAKQAAETSDTVEYGFLIDITVADETDALPIETNASEFSATARMVDFIERTIAVMRAAKPAQMFFAAQYATDTVTFFPVFTAQIDVLLTEELTLDVDPFS